MTQRDFYQVLGVARNASQAEIRAAYARLAKWHHPDVVGELPRRLHDVQQAYHCLSHVDRRAEHDRTITEIERFHANRQRRIEHRLRGYDRRHPRVRPRQYSRWRWRLLMVVAAGPAIITGVSLWLI